MTKVGILVGSLRAGSFSRQIAENVQTLFPDGYETEFVSISELPLYNQDFDTNNQVPAPYKTFREQTSSIDAFLFVTPEYNRSVPGGLKNALDTGSRPKTESVWAGKQAAVISVSPGNLGAFGANHHLRQSLVCLDMPVVQQPEVYLANVATLLDDNGKLIKKDTIQFLQGFVDTFVRCIENNH